MYIHQLTPKIPTLQTSSLKGGELFERLATNGAYTEGTASRLIHRIAQAVSFVHSQGYVHLDIKPSNLVFAKALKHKGHEATDIKLIDFGQARRIDDTSEVDSKALGTVAYLAPELLARMKASRKVRLDVDLAQCDVYTIGVIAFILLFACHPFDLQRGCLREASSVAVYPRRPGLGGPV